MSKTIIKNKDLDKWLDDGGVWQNNKRVARVFTQESAIEHAGELSRDLGIDSEDWLEIVTVEDSEID